ncbi:MAG: thioredoxin domain-containing protein [Candidatus Scalindua sp.]|nr:thioredoxin domain-containing protein [Candidatus Scalindua sp.]MDV5167070.1 thioredoxin domain-containing protein [Candidatus Scalindua sp.]
MKHKSAEGDIKKHYNRLKLEKSPYLLQHADNPVDWYAWGPEAFEKARKENKPIFLSIGYSTCHWCHVMAHESFDNSEVARLMNEVFICIKVDREERQDIDNIYMRVCQMMTGSGGWPLTILMTPEKKPFFAGTYIPRESNHGRLGMLDLIPRIKEVWSTQHDEIINSADQITEKLNMIAQSSSGSKLDKSTLKAAYDQLNGRYSEQYGGFGTAPKFPSPQNLLFLLRYWQSTNDEKALRMVVKTLQSMQNGGIYDHIGYGFHRYSTDSHWLVPHFEKMLYDQAMLAMAYIEAYQATGIKEFEETAKQIFTYVMRDMTDKKGGFYSAEDADSEGVEGKFYVWTEEEIRQILKGEEADLIINVYSIDKTGNFRDEATGENTGANILHLDRSLTEVAFNKESVDGLKERVEAARQILFAVRNKRVHPHKDDKILTDWNGLMIVALAKGAQAFDEPKYAEAAKRATDFILTSMRREDGRVLHRYRDGHTAILANVDDYAFLIWGLLELYETVFDVDYLRTALDLNSEMIKYFWDEQDGGFYFTAEDAEELIVRQKEIYDGAIPSGNSVAVSNLFRLSRITANTDFEDKANKIMLAFSKEVESAPSGYTQMMVALGFGIGPSYEIVIVGDPEADDTKEMLNSLGKHFIPYKVVLLKHADQETADITRIAEYTEYHSSFDGKATAYVCLDFACKMPVTNTEEMLKLLNVSSSK